MTQETTAAMAASDGRHADAADGLRQWILEHDDRWLFTLPYIGLAVVLSIWISLFWLVAVVAGHGLIEVVRQRHHERRPLHVIGRALWEIRLDLALILFALALAAWMDLILGVAGLGNVARLGAHASGRIPGWARAIRGVALSLDDVAQAARVVARRGAGQDQGANHCSKDTPVPAPIHAARPSPWQPAAWSVGDWLTLAFAAACLLATLLAPALLGHDFTWLGELLAAELHPWPTPDHGGNR